MHDGDIYSFVLDFFFFKFTAYSKYIFYFLSETINTNNFSSTGD